MPSKVCKYTTSDHKAKRCGVGLEAKVINCSQPLGAPGQFKAWACAKEA